MCVCVYVHAREHVRVNASDCMFAFVFICIYICDCECVNACIHLCVYRHVDMIEEVNLYCFIETLSYQGLNNRDSLWK